jgi:NSS family neurotransmitter:Na+ symporter
MANLRESSQGGWKSRWTFISAATAATVGLGNLWKFAYLTGENGGGAFVLVYLSCVLLVGIPVMVAEVLLGSRGRANPIDTMHDVSLEAGLSRWWQGVGWLGCLAGIIILSYYSVIAGWGMAYIEKLFNGDFLAVTAQTAGKEFTVFLAEPKTLMMWQALFIGIVVTIVSLGVRVGLAMVSRLLLPLLFVALISLALYSSRVGDLPRALDFLFGFNLELITAQTVLTALGHVFFTLSIGVGAIMAYGAYAPDRKSILGMVASVAVLDTLVSLIAGLAIFPLVFSLNIEPAMGPGLMFVALPYAFGNMVYGEYFGALFFAMVSLAAIGSGVALMEPWVAWLVERFRLWRPFAALILGFVLWLLGLLAVFSFNTWSDVQIMDMSLFSFMDFISTNILLPLGGLLIAFFVGWRMRAEVLKDELYVESNLIFVLWHWVLKYIALPAVVVIFIFSFYQRFSG